VTTTATRIPKTVLTPTRRRVPNPEYLIAQAIAERDLAFDILDDTDITGWDQKIIDQAIRAFAATGVPFSANNIRPLLPDVNTNRIGREFKRLHEQGELRCVGEEVSEKKTTHGKNIGMWVGSTPSLVEAGAA
jgi:hypothetical protein